MVYDEEVMSAGEAGVIVEKATVEVFSLMLGMELRVGPPSENARPFERAEISGLVGFTGARVGYVALHLTRDDAHRFTSGLLSLESSAALSEDQVRDAVEEMTNMIAGTVKCSLGSTEPIALGLPTVLQSPSDSSLRVKDLRSIVVPFDFDDGSFRVEFVVKAAE